ncbi:MAG: TetR/AcrR family transcriptional regulator [Pseudomonadota bacterium]
MTKTRRTDAAGPPAEPAAPQKFLDAAARLFAREGFHGVSMRDIARALGVTPGAVYAHFPSKAAVLAAVYAEGVRRVASAVDAALAKAPEADPWLRLERAAAAHLQEILDQESGYASVVIRVLPADAPDLAGEMTALRDAHEARFRDLVDALALPAGTDRTLFRMTLLGALNWTPVWRRPEQATPPAAIARAIVSMLRRGAPAGASDSPEDGKDPT